MVISDRGRDTERPYTNIESLNIATQKERQEYAERTVSALG